MKNMNKVFFLGAVFAASGAFAGIHVDNVTRDIKTKAQEGATQTMLVQDGMMRTNGGKNGSIILKGATITIIDDSRKEYRVMTKEELKKMVDSGAAAMAKMREQMKSMPPEQRAMMEKMMGSKIPGGMGSGEPDVWASKNMGTTGTVEGRKCTVWQLTRNGAPFEEMCVVPFNTLAGKEDFQKVFKEMSEAFADLAKTAPNGDMGAKARMAIDGFPVRTRMYASDGKFQPTETVMVKWVEESIPASMFEVPAGYKKAEMPKRPN